MRARCDSVFGARGLTELQAGCYWFVDWFQAADNPSLVYHEVQFLPEFSAAGIARGGSVAPNCGG
ncbi:MAG: hypothetical protein OEZ06_02540 [Myxococcales bacterium]|nr:hypothetical protein [Myxococcales bacterium]